MNRKITVSVALAITLIAMTVTFSITWLLSMSTFDNTVSAVTRLQSQYAKLAEIDNYVRGNYYGDIDDNTLFDRIAVGYVNGLGDRYGVYYSEEEYTELLAIENGELVGVGIEVVREADGRFRIIKVYEDSPAARAGVTINGYIQAVDGEPAGTYTTLRLMQRALRGERGTELALDCIYNISDESSFTIQRSNYTPSTVESFLVGDYAYIRIYAFDSGTFTDFDYVLRQALQDEVKGVIFDVRNNAGGLFRHSYDTIDLLSPAGTVAKSMNKTGLKGVLATSDDSYVDLPMVVLVNEGTSAAAELFAVSLRDMNGAQVVGMKTVGRGSIQSTPQRLSDGSAISVTTAILYTGKDETFDLTGVIPDVEVAGGESVTEDMLYNPAPTTDTQTLRAFEVLRTLVRDRGVDPGPAIGGEAAQPDASAAPAASGDGSSLPPEEDSSAGEGDGDASGSQTGDESGSDAGEDTSGTASGSAA